MAYPGFVKQAQLKQAVANRLKRNNTSNVKPYWDEIVQIANRDAYGFIVHTLTELGFDAADIDAWDDGATYQLKLGLYWCSVHGAVYFEETEGELLQQLDCREDLKSLTSIMVGGELVEPTLDDETGPIGYGTIESTTDVHRRIVRCASTGRIRR